MISRNFAFHANRGLMGSINVNELQIENVILAENTVSLVIKTGSDDNYSNSYKARNLYFSAVARPNCPKCYGADLGNVGSNQIGFYLAAISSTAFPPPLTKYTDNIDVICTI